MATKIINYGDFEDWVLETLAIENSDWSEDKINAVADFILEDEKCIKAWNTTQTCSDEELEKKIDMFGTAVDNAISAFNKAEKKSK